MLNFRSALSGLRASQVAIDTLSNNIANANTPGYSRQAVLLVDRPPLRQEGLWIGSGVDAVRINRIANAALESSIAANLASQGRTASALNVHSQIESILAGGPGSLVDQLQSFFDQTQHLQSQPHDPTLRSQLALAATQLAKEFNLAAGQLGQLRRSAIDEAGRVVQAVNSDLQRLFDLNREISIAEAQGSQPNDLIDQHQQLVSDIARSIGLDATKSERGFQYQIGNFSISKSLGQIQLTFDGQNQLQFQTEGGLILQLPDGALAGIQETVNSTIESATTELDGLATRLIEQINSVHATGLSIHGPFALLNSSRPISDVAAPLGQIVQPFSLEAGELFISVTDQANGQRMMSRIDIDPSTQSLDDVAAAISDIPNIQAVVNSQTGKLSVIAAPGFAFDFAGRLESQPDRSSITGNAKISFAGSYSGAQNDTYAFEILGTGSVGVSDSLSVRVTDAAGQELGTFNIGAGFEPGSKIELPEGVAIQFESGTLNQGDSFSTAVVSDADTAGILAAIGLNSLFHGADAGTIAIDPDIAADPLKLSLSRSGEAGDGDNAARLFALRDQAVFSNGNTFQTQLSSQIAQAGFRVSDLAAQESTLHILHSRLQAERNAISGVDQNEELVKMLQFQSSFEASLRVISTIDEMLTELINIIR